MKFGSPPAPRVLAAQRRVKCAAAGGRPLTRALRRALRHAASGACVAAAGWIAAPSPAGDFAWVGVTGVPPGDGTTFISPLNWSPLGPPGASDRAIFEAIGGTILFPGGAIANDRLLIAGPAAPLTLDLNGGLYELASALDLGAGRGLLIALDAGDIATATFSDGALSASNASIAVDTASIGALTVDFDALVSIADGMIVGENGFATLTLLGGLASGSAVVGSGLSSNGQVTIDSIDGVWACLGPLVLAADGMALLQVVNSGSLLVTEGMSAAANFGSSATMIVRDAGSTAIVEGGLVIGGTELAAGGSALVSLENDGLLRVTPLLTVRLDGTLDIVGSRVESPEVLIEGGDAIVNVAGTLVVSDVGTTGEPGIFVGLDGGFGTLTLDSGGAVLSSNGAVAFEPDSGGSMRLTGPATQATFSGVVDVGGEPLPLSRNGQAGVLSLEDGAGLDVNFALTVGQRGVLRLAGGAANVGSANFTDFGTLAITLPQTGAGVVAENASALGGGVVIEPPTTTPLVGATFDLLQAPSIDGAVAVVGAPTLGTDRYVIVEVLDVPGGEALRATVALLPLAFTFKPPGKTDLEAPPAGVVVASFDPDDKLPQAVITVPSADKQAPGTVQLLANTAPPGIQPTFEVVASVPVGEDPGPLAQGVLFGEGNPQAPRPDVAVSNRGGGSISLVRNSSAAPLGAPAGPPLGEVQELAVGGTPGGLAIADVDDDGTSSKPLNDLVVAVAAATGPDYVAIFFNQGGSFGPGFEPVYVGSNPQTVCPIDLTGDKQLDLVTLNAGIDAPTTPLEGPCVTVNFNIGEGGFCDPPKVYEVGLGPIALAEGDLNDDGFVDVVTANAISGTISVLVGKEIGFAFDCEQFEPFHPAIDLDAGGAPLAMAVAAFDFLDGEKATDEDADIAVLVTDPVDGTTKLNVFRNDSTNGQLILAFVPDVQSVAGIPEALTGADVDGDGTPDLVAVGENDGGVAGDGFDGFISVSVSVPICPGDLAGDGDVDGGDLGVLLASWLRVGPDLPADLNGDGIVDSADLGILLNNWGVCSDG